MSKIEEIPLWKRKEVEMLVELFEKNKNVAVIKVSNVNDRQIQDLRKTLRGKAVLRMSKKSLQTRAIERYIEKSKKPNLDVFMENIPGQASLVFTDMNPFELKKTFEDNKWFVPAKSGAVTDVDIWVPAGDTGLPTGQVISELNMTLRLPTMIQSDTIWIRENTRTHKAGDFVTIKQAAVLNKLGVNPRESLVKIYFAWADGEIVPAEVLYMNMEEFQLEIASCYATARTLAIELGIIDDETIEPLLQKLHREALALLFEMPIFADDMVDEYVRKAEINAKIIRMMILGEGIPAAPTQSKPKEEPEPEPEDDEEESVGIGGLF